MEYSEASAYVYAKTSGMLRKTFVGKRSERLFSAQSLSSLWDVIFASPAPSVPEVMLADKIEREALKRFIGQYIKLLDSYSKPSPLSVELLRRYEIENLKSLASTQSQGQEQKSRFESAHTAFLIIKRGRTSNSLQRVLNMTGMTPSLLLTRLPIIRSGLTCSVFILFGVRRPFPWTTPEKLSLLIFKTTIRLKICSGFCAFAFTTIWKQKIFSRTFFTPKCRQVKPTPFAHTHLTRLTVRLIPMKRGKTGNSPVF